MSGVEAASAAALNQSSLTLDSVSKDRNKTRPTVHHVYSRPFWTLPTYVLHESSDETVSFLPLDLAMYDLDRRPPGPIEYALGPIPEEKAAKTTSYFRSLLGTEYEQFGYMQAPDAKDQAPSRPPWVAIGNEYAEYVRSGAIEATMGRAISAQPDPQTGLASINIKTSDDHSKTLDHISVIVMATGFTPFDSLSFLPADVLSALEYSSADPFLPLVLDQGGTLRSELPDIGFVGFYRGPYWGVMEMQARLLGKAWADKSNEPQTTENQRQSLRVLRHPNLELRRGQFPMGDYVGLMETFAKDLGISRIESTNGGSRSGPVIPSRYVYDEASTKSLGKGQTTTDPEAERTLDALRATYIHDHGTAQAAAALAIFRALHGTWKFKRWTPATGEEVISGTAVFHPRYPSDPAYDREYVYEEYPESSAEDKEPIVGGTAQSILHLSEGGTRKSNSRIEIWPLRPVQNVESALDGYALNMTPVYRKKRDGQYIPGEYVVSASSGLLIGTGELAGDVARGRYQYNFHFKGVSISSWERIDLGLDIAGGKSTSEDQAIVRYRSLYVR